MNRKKKSPPLPILKVPVSTKEFNNSSLDLPEYQIDGKVNIFTEDKNTGIKQEKQLTKWGFKCRLYTQMEDITTNQFTLTELYFFKTALSKDVMREVSKVKRYLDPTKLNMQYLSISIIKYR